MEKRHPEKKKKRGHEFTNKNTHMCYLNICFLAVLKQYVRYIRMYFGCISIYLYVYISAVKVDIIVAKINAIRYFNTVNNFVYFQCVLMLVEDGESFWQSK